MKMMKEESMKRGEFLRSLGLSTSTLMAFYCLGTTMTACGSGGNDPAPGSPGGGSGLSGTTTGAAINFTVDLSNSAYSGLKTAGQFKIIGDVLVAFTTGNAYVALAKACTHEGTQLQYAPANNNLFCSNHGSEFSTLGVVQKGPSTGDKIVSLKAYKTSISADGKTLTITV